MSDDALDRDGHGRVVIRGWIPNIFYRKDE